MPSPVSLQCLHTKNKKLTFNSKGESECGKRHLAPNQSVSPDAYYKIAIKNTIFTEVLRRRSNAYVADYIVKAAPSHIHVEFMHMFMAEAAENGRQESVMSWDKDGPRLLVKDFKDPKTWFFSTFRVVAYLASFQELDVFIREK